MIAMKAELSLPLEKTNAQKKREFTYPWGTKETTKSHLFFRGFF